MRGSYIAEVGTATGVAHSWGGTVRVRRGLVASAIVTGAMGGILAVPVHAQQGSDLRNRMAAHGLQCSPEQGISTTIIEYAEGRPYASSPRGALETLRALSTKHRPPDLAVKQERFNAVTFERREARALGATAATAVAHVSLDEAGWRLAGFVECEDR